MSTATEAGDSVNLYAALKAASARLDPERMEGDAFLAGVYSSLVELAGRQLEEVAEGEGDAAWTFHVLQEQIPSLRDAAGLELDDDHPFCEQEREIRKRYGVGVPLEDRTALAS